jgi:hypothetical protein
MQFLNLNGPKFKRINKSTIFVDPSDHNPHNTVCDGQF